VVVLWTVCEDRQYCTVVVVLWTATGKELDPVQFKGGAGGISAEALG
jgi:hypothetical protein